MLFRSRQLSVVQSLWLEEISHDSLVIALLDKAHNALLVKNENNTLPLVVKEKQKILMLCPYDNERAQMIMGYNRAKEAGLIPDLSLIHISNVIDTNTIGTIISCNELTNN